MEAGGDQFRLKTNWNILFLFIINFEGFHNVTYRLKLKFISFDFKVSNNKTTENYFL